MDSDEIDCNTRWLERHEIRVTDRTIRIASLVWEWLGGFHHAPRNVKAAGNGIELVFGRGHSLPTYDGHSLTRLVMLAHDRCVRAEVSTAGMHLSVMLHARIGRGGDLYGRHPTLESAVSAHRARHSASAVFAPEHTEDTLPK
jgi:hypothetical protein